MFAYCRNNPACRIDISGTADADCYDDDPLDEEEILGTDGGGGGFDVQQSILDGNFAGSYAQIPQKAWNVLNFLKSHNWHPPQNYKGGKIFSNDGRNNGQKLPDNGVIYRKYDIDPKIPGEKRGAERIVVGSDGSAWYTPDHYISFYRME